MKLPKKYKDFLKEYKKLCDKYDLCVLSDGEEVEIATKRLNYWGIEESTIHWMEYREKIKKKLESKNKCVCVVEPMGHSGLEGYVEGCDYKYEYKEKDDKGKPYYRVYPNSNDYPNEYETCGKITFNKFFKII